MGVGSVTETGSMVGASSGEGGFAAIAFAVFGISEVQQHRLYLRNAVDLALILPRDLSPRKSGDSAGE